MRKIHLTDKRVIREVKGILPAGILVLVTVMLLSCQSQTSQPEDLIIEPGSNITVTSTPSIKAANSVVVSLWNDDYALIKDDIEAIYTTDFGNGVWLALTQGEFEILQASGVTYDLQRDPIIPVWNYRFDPLVAAPTIPEELRNHYQQGHPEFYLVQFYTAPQDGWVATLQSEGAEHLLYFGGYAYLYRMTLEQARLVEKYDFVRWVGAFEPAYRLPATFSDNLEQPPLAEVVIYREREEFLTVDSPIVNQTVKEIELLGGVLVDRYVTRLHHHESLLHSIYQQKFLRTWSN